MTLKISFFVTHYCNASKIFKSFVFAFIIFFHSKMFFTFNRIPKSGLEKLQTVVMIIPGLGIHVKVPVLPASHSAARKGICCLPRSPWGSHQEPLRRAYSSISFPDNIGDLSTCIAGLPRASAILQQLELKTPFHVTFWHTLSVPAGTFMPC